MNIKEICKKRVEGLLEEKNMTINALAERAGVRPSTIYSFMDEKRKEVKLDTIESICRGLDISISEFFDNDNFKNK
ncbi:MAG: helix-turn-helix transcriptional regulator [Pseudobutyrivibrio ruminis]|uniref:Helix-turn-helix transcriptional regulator n=1 Tax=Pseudobutyrivibrio ruminis TaxID=46206 RepID=A0A927U7F8_9FIRM|nr:helix-turn-helix transcriptional regulator [Pseudobutyrivibrio ruminis]